MRKSWEVFYKHCKFSESSSIKYGICSAEYLRSCRSIPCTELGPEHCPVFRELMDAMISDIKDGITAKFKEEK